MPAPLVAVPAFREPADADREAKVAERAGDSDSAKTLDGAAAGSGERRSRAARFAAPEPYLEAIARAGGRPLLLVPSGLVDDGEARPGEVESLLARMDALVLPGGADLDPRRYGAPRHPRTGESDADRDGLELALAAAARSLGVPTLAICRGFQVLNVALGGTLHQHLPDDFQLDHGRDGDTFHAVRAAAGSELARVCGADIERCTSHHHQGVDRLAEGLVATGWSEDCVIEAAEPAAGEGGGWILAVQWHPERSAASDPVQQALFDSLVARASA